MNAVMKAAMDEMREQLASVNAGGFATADDVLAVARRVSAQGFDYAEAYQAANVAESAIMRAKRERGS